MIVCQCVETTCPCAGECAREATLHVGALLSVKSPATKPETREYLCELLCPPCARFALQPMERLNPNEAHSHGPTDGYNHLHLEGRDL